MKRRLVVLSVCIGTSLLLMSCGSSPVATTTANAKPQITTAAMQVEENTSTTAIASSEMVSSAATISEAVSVAGPIENPLGEKVGAADGQGVMTFTANGTIFTLPMSAKDIVAIGYGLERDEEIGTGMWAPAVTFTKVKYKDTVSVSLVNMLPEPKMLSEATVTSIKFTNESSFFTDMVLANGIKFGDSLETVSALYDEEALDRYDSEDKKSTVLTYNENNFTVNTKYSFTDNQLTAVQITTDKDYAPKE